MDSDNLLLAPGITGPFTTAWLLMGYEQSAIALYDDPALLTEIFRMSNEYNKEAARRAVAAGVRGDLVGRRPGRQPRGFMKLTHFRKYYLPYLADLAEYVDEPGRAGAAALLRPLHRLPARPGADEDRGDPPAAAHGGHGPA